MEPVSFAIGILGLAGLFSTCLDAAGRIDTWLEYDTDYNSLQAQYNAQKLRLEKWGLAVGLHDQELSDEHSKLLDDPQTSAAVKDLLLAISAVCREEETPEIPTIGKQKQHLKDQLFQRRSPRDSKRQKLRWALGTKAKRAAQVEQFSSLVENLHNLVPIEDNKGGKDRKSSREGILENRAWKSELRELIQSIEAEMEDEIRREIHAWLLGSASSSELFDRFIEKRIEGTCDWVLDQSLFRDWTSATFPDGRAKILWINGPAGFGKSFMCARITDSLSSSLEDPLGHFFISSDFEDRKDPFTAIRSWISQLFQHPVVFSLVREVWSGRPEQKATRSDTLKLLRMIATTVPRCTFVLDGLDECSWSGNWQSFHDDNPTIEFLSALRKAIAGTSTRILIVSRDEPEIRNCLSNNTDTKDAIIYQHKIRPEDVQSDVEAFSRSMVNKKLSSRPEAVREDIAQKLAERCNGQFLWVKMQEDHLRSGKSQKKLEQAISSTPPGIEHTYDRNWMRISNLPEDDRDRTISLLRWAAFALRPLTVFEVSGALAISQDCDEVELEELPDCIDEDYLNTEILELCGSLVEIRGSHAELEPGLRTVRLAHFSVKQYLLCNLTGRGKLLQVNARLKPYDEMMQNTLLAKMCLLYVDCEDVWKVSFEEEAGEILCSFRDYAADSWHRHARMGEIHDGELVKQMNRLFNTENTNWHSWKEWFDLNAEEGGVGADSSNDESSEASEDSDNSGDSDDSDDSEDPDELDNSDNSDGSDDSDDSNASDSQSSTTSSPQRTSTNPLYYASLLGLIETTELLLKSKYSVDEQGNDGHTPLVVACWKGNLDIVKKLLDEGADMNIQNDWDHDALRMAACFGHYEVTMLLLEKGADSTALALLCAVENGHYQVAQLFLERGPQYNSKCGSKSITPTNTVSAKRHVEVARLLHDIEIPSGWVATPLYSASVNGHTDIVRLLLDHGANVDCRNQSGWTPINAAADEGFLEIVELLIEKGADFEIPTSWGRTALYNASMNGHTEIVRLLLDHGANVDCQNQSGWTPINAAADEGFLEIVELLIVKGADFEIPTSWGRTALYNASMNGHTEIVRLLLDHGANVDCRNQSGWTPINAAADEGFLEIVELLIEKGADFEIPTSWGRTALYNASMNGHTEIVRLLLDHGANVDCQNQSGWTPINAAADEGFLEIVELLIVKGADFEIPTSWGRTALYNASMNGHTEIVRLLLDHGANVDCRNQSGWTPINAAADEGFLEIVELLIEKGADFEIPTSWGRTALYNASMNGHTEIVRLLLDHGANVDCRNQSGWTPINAAADEGFLEIVELLIEKGADFEIPTSWGRTALYNASMNGHTEIVRLLLDHGANVDCRNQSGWTPINAAADEGFLEIVELLIEKGADFEIPTSWGRTALYNASMNGHTEIVRLLLDHGANVDCQNQSGWTPINAAADEGFLEIVELLIVKGAGFEIPTSWGQGALYNASVNGDPKIVRLLLSHGAKVDSMNRCGSTPLLGAASENKVDAVELLLDAGANPNHPANDGMTPLMEASNNGHMCIVKLLINYGAEITASSTDNWTALQYACQNGHFQTAEFFLENGASFDVADEDGYTALHAAAANGHLGVVRLLTDKGADLTTSDKDGWSTIHFACNGGSRQTVEFLLDNGEIPNTADNDGFSLLHTAAQSGHLKVVKLLMKRLEDVSRRQGSDQDTSTSETFCNDIDLPDNFNRTPLFCAAREGHKDVVEILLPHSSVDFKDRYGATPLCAAVRNGHEDVVKQLTALSNQKSQFEDGLGRNLLWWAIGTGKNTMVDIVSEFARDMGIQDPQASEGEECLVVNLKNKHRKRPCVVCTRYIPSDTSYLGCKVCNDFEICFQCLELKAECFGPSHEWSAQEPDGSDSESDEDEDSDEDCDDGSDD
ncbi:hypothetical protein N7505_001315 [Penicillium chrysogenum]|uniref:Ankyrin repeat domain-containing protein n=1 Tax=Penicillium chrysogenum TaxID=5076 RepID=A0ABQ8WWB1_PENCH|nr:hypothetical protein N7505_001315 [Penicillium chrysogenum]